MARGQYRLEGTQTFYYASRQKQWEVTYRDGRKTGVETYWGDDGRKQWERSYSAGGGWTGKIFDRAGRVSAESRWKGKILVEV